MTDDQFLERVAEVLTEESVADDRRTWWLSFADAARPTGEQFLGVIIVDDCPGLAHARMMLTVNGVASPGGEIQGVGFTPDMIPEGQREAFAKLPRLTLLSKDDLVAAGIEMA